MTQGFSLFGKEGVVRGDEDGNLNFGGPAYRLDGSTELTYGLGLKYDFSSNLGLRLEWQRFTPGGYLQPFGEGDVDLLSGGLKGPHWFKKPGHPGFFWPREPFVAKLQQVFV